MRKFLVLFLTVIFAGCASPLRYHYGEAAFPYASTTISSSIDGKFTAKLMGRISGSASVTVSGGKVINAPGNYGYFSGERRDISSAADMAVAGAKYNLIQTANEMGAVYLSDFVYTTTCNTKGSLSIYTATVYALAYTAEEKDGINSDED